MKTKTNIISQIAGLLLLTGAFAALNVNAQDLWTGGGNGTTFGDGNNWSSTLVPTTGDALEFGTPGPSTTLTNDLIGYAFPSITYDASGIGFTITGNAFTNGTSTANTIITVNSANTQTINNNLTLGNAVQTITLNNGSLTLGGVLGGAGTASSLSINANTFTLSLNGANTFGSAGSSTINNGTVSVGNVSAFGQSRVNIYTSGGIDLNGHNLSVAFINNSGALTGGNIDNVSAGGTVTLKVGSGQGGVSAANTTYTSIDSFSGSIKNTTGTVGLTKVAPSLANQTAGIMATASLLNGPDVLRLANGNTYTGPTTINGGILELNFGNSTNGGPVIANNIISPSSALVVAGGDLTIDTPETTSLGAAQTFSGLTLNAGASHLASYRPNSGSASLNMNGITRNIGSTVDFQSRPSGSSSNQKLGAADGNDTTTNINANFTGGQTTILGGYATYNTYVSGGGGSWAVSGNTANTTKTLTALAASGYTTNTAFVAGKDMDVTNSVSTPAAMTINSLRFNTTNATAAIAVNSSGNIVVATGGILETLTVANNTVAINNNNLTSGNGQDLIIHQYNTGAGMTIGANIVDNGGPIGLTKSGPGALTLTPNAANTFSGQLTLNAGTVTLGNASALNGVPAVVFGGMSQTLGGAGPNFIFANGTLNLNGNSVSVASLTASAESSGNPTVQNTSGTPATLTVNGSATTSFTGTLQDGSGGGALSLIKSGSGSQTIGGTLAYSGSTTVSAGTLALTTPTTNTSSYAVNGTLNVTALTSNTLALTSPQTLSGSGTVNGNVTVASGAHTRPGATGVTNTITGNLAYVTGAKADFDLNTSATNTPSDQIVLSGASSVLTCGSIQVNINLMGATLDTNNDYVLFKLSGGSTNVSGTFLATPSWLGTVPANSGSYSIITGTNNVRLHFTQAVAPTVTGSATPSSVVRNESTFISVTATPGGSAITNVYLDMSSIGGSLSVPLTLSDTPNVYTNTVAIPAAASVGGATIHAYATDTTPLTGSGNITLTIVATNEVWNGGSLGTANWSDNTNWVSVFAPGLVGDSVTIDGTTQTSPNMDNSYSVTSLNFPSTAGAFTIGTANGSVLTLTGGATNNSTSAQILDVPVSITATQVVNTAAGDITLGGAVSGGGLTKVGNNTLYLGSSGNTYTGSTVISNGTVSVNQNASIGANQIVLAGGTLASGYASGTRWTAGSPVNVPAGNTGTILMSALNRFNGTFTGSGLLNISAPGGQDDIGGSWNTYAGQINIFGGGTFRLVINGGNFNGFDLATVTMTNVSMSVSDNSTGNSFNVGALNIDSTATILGPYQGSSPNFTIGGLNSPNDVIAGSVQGGTRITKVGTGNLTISSASGTATYTGQTLVNGGTLTVSGVISSSPVTNYSGTTLTGIGTLNGPVDLETNSTISPVTGNTLGIFGTMTCGSDLTFNGATNVVHINTNYCDLITVGGNLTLNSGAARLVVDGILTNGIYKLITYSGSLNGTPGNLILSGFSQPGKTAVLSDATSGEIDLIVTPSGGASLTWGGIDAANAYWDIVSSLNWSNGPSLTYFTPGDHVTFDDSYPGNTTVDVREIVLPSSMVVTSAQAYVFQTTTGSGKLSGPTNSLTVSGTGSLELDLVNDYGGPTAIGSGYTLTVGNGNDSASLGSGLITNNGTLVFNQTNNLSLTNILGTGSGTLTKDGAGTLTLTANNTYDWTTIGAGATVQVGTGGATGTLGSGVITNDGRLVYNRTGSITVANINTGPANGGEVDFIGAASVTLNGGNTYINNTVIDGGVVKLAAAEVIPSAATVTSPATSTGWLVLDGGTTAGTLDLNGFNQSVNALSGLSGTVDGLITNSATSATTTNLLTVLGSGATTYYGTIAENTNGGSKIALILRGANQLELRGANTYSGGTIVGDTATLALHNNTAGGFVAGVSGGILMSNGTTLRMNAASGSADPSIFPGNAVTIVDGASVTFSSQQAANGFAGTVAGSATATVTIGGASTAQVSFSSTASKQFQSLLGTVLIPSGDYMRWSANTAANGGDFTTFDVEGNMTSKNGAVSLGALTGAGSIDGGGQAGTITYTVGLNNADSTFTGTLRDGSAGTFSLVKSGTGTLTLSGAANYTGPTTVSNGGLALMEPVSLDNNATINVSSSTAVIDVSGRTDGTLNLGNLFAQTLNGIGTITGNLNNQANSTVKVGLGVLNVSGTATLAGTNVLQLNRTNTPATNSEIVATTFVISGPLTVTNTGPALQGGDTFQLFNQAVSGFTITNLPALTGAMYWTNKLAVNGSIAVVNPVNPLPGRISASFSGTTLSLGWPTNGGWTLQMQTNSLSTGLGTNWVDVPGSTTITSTNITVDPKKPTVFYRLKL